MGNIYGQVKAVKKNLSLDEQKKVVSEKFAAKTKELAKQVKKVHDPVYRFLGK